MVTSDIILCVYIDQDISSISRKFKGEVASYVVVLSLNSYYGMYLVEIDSKSIQVLYTSTKSINLLIQ